MLLLPGDIFARRNVAPVLQQLESEHTQDISVNDCFKPVSRYWDRITRPEQLLTSLPEAMHVLTSPAETGAVTLALPEDVQTEAYDYPKHFSQARLACSTQPPRPLAQWSRRQRCIRASKRPLIIAGGGVIYAEATETLQHVVEQTGIPVGETMAGKGSLRYDHPLSIGAIGATGTFAANRIASDADLVIGIGTRYSDFTTSSKTAFQHPEVRFININVAQFDADKALALPLVGDAQATLEELLTLLVGYSVDPDYRPAGRATPPGVGGRGRAHLRYPQQAAAQSGRVDWRGERIERAHPPSWCVPQEVCLATCTSSGGRVIPRTTTWSMAIAAWAMRSPGD